jgi:hypothetical protein
MIPDPDKLNAHPLTRSEVAIRACDGAVALDARCRFGAWSVLQQSDLSCRRGNPYPIAQLGQGAQSMGESFEQLHEDRGDR